MEGNSSIETRYSFNIAQTSPVAESTHIGNSFSWGSSISMRPRSNSNLCLSHSYSSSKSKNVTKIDARIAADVQSKGLASRIVKYHESGARLNRSISAHNLYSRPGQFPAVTLRKTELPYRAAKQELSIIRIPPPEKSTFYGNTISSLLKSSSVVGLKSKRTEENRPIIHPPPSENDMAPTRSVLDVLKEISRKRINSDDLETDETSKKYCNRGFSDSIDAGTCAASTTTMGNIVSSTSQRFKRQRDCITPHQSFRISEVKTSPEQAKKRVCNYNNDITSSLSSSLKGRFNEKKRASYSLSHTMSSNFESHKTQTKKIQCFHDHQNSNDQTDVRLENLVNDSCRVDSVKPITPIPTTPCAINEDISSAVGPRTISDPFYSSNGKNLANEMQPVNKPQLTLFNKKYEVAVENDLKKSTSKVDDLNNFDEYAGIPFVKPKKISISALKNPVIERTQKSKLALMLSGLKGELYQNSEKDDVDSSKEEHVKAEDRKINVVKDTLTAASKSVSTMTNSLITATPSYSLNSTTGVSDTSKADLTTNELTNLVQTNTTPKKTSSPLVGLKLNQIKSPTNDVSSVNDTKHTNTKPKTNMQALSLFSISATNTSTSASALTTITSGSPIKPTSTVSTASNLVTIGQPTSSNFSIGLNIPSTKDSALSFPLASSNSTNSNPKTPTSSNLSLSTINTTKPKDSFVFGTNVMPLTTSTNILKPVDCGTLSFNNSTTKPNSSFNFSFPSQTSARPPDPISSLTLTTTTSTISLNTDLSKTTAGGISFAAVTETTNVTSMTPTVTTFPFQSKTSAPVAVTEMPTGSSSTSTFNFNSKDSTTNASTFSVNSNTGITVQSTNPQFTFGSLSKTQSTASDDKNNSSNTSESSNPFKASASTFFGATNLNASINTPLFESSTDNTGKNVFGTSNVPPTSVFGSNSIKNDSQIFGSSTDKKSSIFSTNNNTPAPFSFDTKPIFTQTENNPTKPGGFSFASNISSSEGGSFGFSNTVKPTTTKTFNFGSNSNKTENNSTPTSGFSFNSTTAQKPTFNFSATGNPTASFSFGGASSPLPAETSIKPFSFGTQQSQAHQSPMPLSNSASSNIFGSSGASKAVPSPTFSFNSGNSTNLQQTGQTTNNIFAPPPLNITTGPGDRQIRRATRRLQK